MSVDQQDGVAQHVINPQDIAAPAGPGEFNGDVKAPTPGVVRFSKNTKIAAIIIGVVLIGLVAYGVGIFDTNKQPVATMTPAPPLALPSGGSAVSTTTNLASALDGSNEHGVATPPPPNLAKSTTANTANGQNQDALAAALNNGAGQGATQTNGTSASSSGSAPQDQATMGPAPTFAPFQPQGATVPDPGSAAAPGYGPSQNQVASTQGAAPTQGNSAQAASLYVGGDNVGQGAQSPSQTQNGSGGDGGVNLPQSSAGGNAMASGASGSTNPVNPNTQSQEQRIKFANGDGGRPPYLTAVRESSIGKFELWAGSIIPAQLDTGVNADLPGVIRAHVTQDVYDSKTGQTLIIPKWSTIIGRYNSVVTQGQARIQVVFDRLIWPDGSYIGLDGMSGADKEGNAGLFADVNDHRGQIFTASILTGIISAGAEILAGGQGGTTVVQSNGQVVSQSVGGQLAQTGGQYVQQKMNIPPELTVPRGQNFTVLVDRTIVLSPWQYDQSPQQ